MSNNCCLCFKKYNNKITNCENCFNFDCCERCFIKLFIKHDGNINCPLCFNPRFETKLSHDRYEELLENYLKIAKLENNEVVKILTEIAIEEDSFIIMDKN
jgi:hypothetical protein